MLGFLLLRGICGREEARKDVGSSFGHRLILDNACHTEDGLRPFGSALAHVARWPVVAPAQAAGSRSHPLTEGVGVYGWPDHDYRDG